MIEPVRAVDVRVLDGPNLYFPRPAMKLTLSVPGWMRAAETTVARACERLGVAASPGLPSSEARRRTTARFGKVLTHRLAITSGAERLAVRTRPGPATGEIVVAFPWRRRGSAVALAEAVCEAMALTLRRSPGRVIAELAARVAAAGPGAQPEVPDPKIPTIQVTGTNGKTTTVRLLAHMVCSAGLSVAYSCTDGVFSGDGDLIEAGDYSGFGGAARALAAEPDIAVLETARGGMLLRGCGVLHNDVAVVTNVSEDHLGLHGIDTVDQLAEVKAIPTRITRPTGWDVLNADDPRVLAMRRHARGRPWLFSLHPDHPAFRDVLAGSGRAMTVIEDRITWLEGHDAHPLIAVQDVPATLAGISRINLANALAAAAAGLAVGLPERAVVKSLRTFVLDPERNPGRANLFKLDQRVVVVDYAHNEAGMLGLLDVLHGLRRKGRDVWLAIGTAGDRTDAILHAFAFRAAAGSDHLAFAELLHYLRDRTREDIVRRLGEGAAQAGITNVPIYEDELDALRAMTGAGRPGDVVGVTALAKRPEVFAWLAQAGATRMSPAQVRTLVRQVKEEGTT